MISNPTASGWYPKVARTGLTAKGIVYCLSGLLAFMAAFEISNRSSQNADARGVFKFVQDQAGGKIVVLLIAAGLVCYSIWRAVQAFSDTEREGRSAKGWGKRLRYLFSGLVYLSLAVYAVQLVLQNRQGSGSNSNQNIAGQLLSQPFGQWLVGILAVALAAVGVYLCYYGFSKKYEKHVHDMPRDNKALLNSGRIGYMAKGLVWIIISFFMLQAALHANASEAGSTNEAFRFLENGFLGSYLLGAVGVGLIGYGVFNFIRARYESF